MTTISLLISATEADVDRNLRQPLRLDEDDVALPDAALLETFLISGPSPRLDVDLIEYAVPARGYGLCE
jgi:hypothetical protein